jgi:hypothetical protein
VAEELEWLAAVEEMMADPEAEEEVVEDPILEEVVVAERKTSRCRWCDGRLVGLKISRSQSEAPTTTDTWLR